MVAILIKGNGCGYLKSADEDWNNCGRLGQVKQKTCDSCVFNKKNKELRAKASKYYRFSKS